MMVLPDGRPEFDKFLFLPMLFCSFMISLPAMILLGFLGMGIIIPILLGGSIMPITMMIIYRSYKKEKTAYESDSSLFSTLPKGFERQNLRDEKQ